jgi:hypothetical protein
MTEAEWSRTRDISEMIGFVRDKYDCSRGGAGHRTLRFLMAAACRRSETLLDDPEYLALIEAVERVARGKLSPATLARYRTNCPPLRVVDYVAENERRQAASEEFNAEYLAKRAVWLSGCRELTDLVSCLDHAARAVSGHVRTHEEVRVQCELLRDIFGNPFRPVTLDPAWRTSTVVALAEGIYADRAFDRLPILADALQDAGCDHPDLLGHCRDPQLSHVRGCWAVDMVLAKT